MGGGGEVGTGVGLDCLLRSEFDFLYLDEHVRTQTNANAELQAERAFICA